MTATVTLCCQLLDSQKSHKIQVVFLIHCAVLSHCVAVFASCQIAVRIEVFETVPSGAAVPLCSSLKSVMPH